MLAVRLEQPGWHGEWSPGSAGDELFLKENLECEPHESVIYIYEKICKDILLHSTGLRSLKGLKTIRTFPTNFGRGGRVPWSKFYV